MLSDIELVDIHAHLPPKSNFSSFIDSFVKDYSRSSLGSTPSSDDSVLIDHITKRPFYKSFLNYLANVHGREPIVQKIDEIIMEKTERDYIGYIEEILGREKIRSVLLELPTLSGEQSINTLTELGMSQISGNFPPKRWAWFLRIDRMLQPYWRQKISKNNFEAFLDIIENEIKIAVKNGCVGFKSAIGYYRLLKFDETKRLEATKAYQNLREKKPCIIDYNEYPIYLKQEDKKQLENFQNFIIRYILSKANELNKLFIFHTGFGGPSPYPDLRNANPLPLHSIFNDENYRKTKFLILHQSYPYVKEAAILTSQFSHVYMDVSYFYLRPQTLQNSLRTILENAPPQKILYGSDTARLAETYGYSAWLFRIYLSRVLSEMGNNYSLSENELIEIAKMIMNENAEKLIGI
jgi:hypothetical protein